MFILGIRMRIMPRASAADYARASYAGEVEARVAKCLLSLSSLVFVLVSKPRWPRRTVIPDLHLHRQRTPSAHLSELSISECVTIDYVIWPIVCNDIPRDIPERDPPRTYARTYIRTL